MVRPERSKDLYQAKPNLCQGLEEVWPSGRGVPGPVDLDAYTGSYYCQYF